MVDITKLFMQARIQAEHSGQGNERHRHDIEHLVSHLVKSFVDKSLKEEQEELMRLQCDLSLFNT